jgi:hypothetical protein
MQRTTVRLPDDLLNEAKDLARQTGRTLTQLLEDAVRAELARTAMPKSMRVAERGPRYTASAAFTAPLQGEHVYATSEAAPPNQLVREQLRAQVADIQAFVRTLPDRDTRSADDILGYDANGLPG